MFGIDWSELMIIAVVAIIIIGPKDLPKVMRSIGKATSKMRATAFEFRQQFDEAMKEAELDDIKSTLDDLRNLDPRRSLTTVFDPLRDSANDVKQSFQETNNALKGLSTPSLKDQEILNNSDLLPPANDTNHEEYLMQDHFLKDHESDEFYDYSAFDGTLQRKSKTVKHHTSFEMKRPLRQHCIKRYNARFSFNRYGRKAAHYFARSSKTAKVDEMIKNNMNGAKISDE